MKIDLIKHFCSLLVASVLLPLGLARDRALATDKLVGLYSAQVMSMSLPWIAQEAGLFRKYNLDFQGVYLATTAIATAAILGGDADVVQTGGTGIARAFVQGATDLVIIGAVKNALTQSILAGRDIEKPEDLKGKKIGVSRIGSNSHYFTIQALRRFGFDSDRDITFVQSGGEFETLAALSRGSIQAATLTPPADATAIARGFHYVVYGPDLRIPQTAVAFITRRSLIAKRSQVLGRFMLAMAEASKFLHTDKEFTYKVLTKQLRVENRNVLDAAYNAEIKVLEQRLEIKPEALQAILEDVAQIDPRAKKVKPQDLIDYRYLDEMDKSGFFDQLWGGKR
jgi:ABC-type nitrate/sulfonate/bicarbonate transport system substrate-binding protein